MALLTGPPQFQHQKKIANQPITTAVSENPVTKKGHNWLLGNFLFGTEIGEGQLEKTPSIMMTIMLTIIVMLMLL